MALAHQRQDRAGADIGLAGTGWPLDRQDRPIHVIHHGNGACNRFCPAQKIASWARAQTRCSARQQVVHRRVPARAALIGDHIAQSTGNDTCLDRPVRMQRQLIRQEVGLARACFDSDLTGTTIHRLDPDRCRGTVEHWNRRLLAAPQFRFLFGIGVSAREGSLDGFDRTSCLKPAKRIKIVEQIIFVLRSAIEHNPLRGLHLTAVKNAEVEQHILPRLGQAGPRQHAPQCLRIGILFDLLFPGVRGKCRPRADGPDANQPVAQFLGRDTVDAVVILYLVQNLLILRFAPALIGHDRATRRLDLAVALAIVKSLHRFDGIVRFRSDQPAAHDSEQIDEAAFPQQPVEESLTDPIFRGQAFERCDLVWRVVIDARSGVLRNPRAKKRQQVGQCPRFCVVVMGPERLELPVEPDAVQVFEAALVVWIAFDVVEQVARLRFWQQVEAFARLGCPQFEIWLPGFAGLLQAGLRDQTGLGVISHPADRMIQRRESLQCVNTRCFKLFDLTTTDVGDIEQAVFGLPDAIAMIGPAAQAAIGTWHRARRRRIRYECFQPFARHPCIGRVVCQAQRRAGAVSQFDMRELGHHPLNFRQQIGI